MSDDRDPKGTSTTETKDAMPPQAPAAPAKLEPGTRLGRFIVGEPLGQGGMGVVYAARDPELNRQVAIKLLRLGRDDATSKARLMREAQAMARLSHPNVVTVHEVGAHGDGLFVAMEHVDGQTLKGWLRERPRTPREIVALFLQAAKGLAAAHAAGIIHRDFKPDNVLISRDGRARVSDFGVARAVGESDLPVEPSGVGSGSDVLSSTLTQEGAVVGTLAYMAPEQLQGSSIDPRTDQFAFSVALFEALMGERPYTREDRRLHRRRPPTARIPGWLNKVVERGISLAPGDRYPDMPALIAALEADPAPRRARLLGAAGLVAITALAALVTVRLTRHRSACDAPDRALEGVWNDGERAKIEAAFLGSGAPEAEVRWSYARKALEREAGLWTDAEKEVCATSASKAQAESAVAIRLECLDRQRDDFAVALQLLEKPTPELVTGAVPAIQSLSEPKACEDAATLPIIDHLPPDKAAIGKTVRAELVRSVVARETGAVDKALADQEALVPTAASVGDPALEVRLQTEIVATLGRSGRHQEAETHVREALRIAEASRMDLEAAQLSAQLAQEIAIGAAPPTEIEAALEQMSHAVDRARGSPLARSSAELALGTVLNLQGFPEKSIPHIQEAIRLDRELEGPDTLRALLPLNNLGASLESTGKYDESIAVYRDAIGLADRVKGPIKGGHRILSLNLGMGLVQLGRPGAAEALAPCFVPPEDIYGAIGHAVLGEALDERGEGGEGEAFAHIAQAMAILDRMKAEDTAEGVLVQERAALVYARHGQPEPAKRLAQLVFDHVSRQLDANSEDWVDTLYYLGAAWELVGDTTRARVQLDRALALANRPFVPGLLARIRYRLARALVESHGDRARAAQLAKQADDELAGLGFLQKLHAEVAAWRRATFRS